MNVDAVLKTFNDQQVAYLLIGGMNFLLRHAAYVTYDIDLWIDDTPDNRQRCAHALSALNAEWGPTDETWTHVSKLPADWLERQGVFSLTCPDAAVDIFRSVAGLGSWQESFQNSEKCSTSAGIQYFALCDDDMLKCQYALAPHERKEHRVRYLEDVVKKRRDENG